MSKSAKTKSAKATVEKASSTAARPPAKKPVKKVITPEAKKPVSKMVTAALAQGSQAPDFTLPRDGGGNVSLSDFINRKLVIFFYPRADTPGCTLEAVDFTRIAGDFAACNTAVVGVSADPIKAQDKFRDKHGLAIPLLSDETHAMLISYGAWGEKSMYGKMFEGVLRTTVLIDTGGKIARVWSGVKVDGHADAVLEAARHLQLPKLFDKSYSPKINHEGVR